MEENINIQQKNIRLKTWILNIFLIVGFVAIFSYYFLSAPFGNKDVIIHIFPGESVTSIIQELELKNSIRNDLTLKIFIKIFKNGKGIITGDYLIKKKSPVWIVAWQITKGHHNIEPIKITLREGLTNIDIANIFSNKIASFRRDLFMSLVKNKQGYLFPDTYFFYPLDTTEEIVEKLSNNFENKIKKVALESKNLNEIIVMASILEGEASGKDDIEIISGILWKRVLIGMPLQVDIDKSTYSTKGLPSNPLNNPGLLSINAAINPTDSKYLYYIHDKEGVVHYAVNFEEHKRNINKYLK